MLAQRFCALLWMHWCFLACTLRFPLFLQQIESLTLAKKIHLDHVTGSFSLVFYPSVNLQWGTNLVGQ